MGEGTKWWKVLLGILAALGAALWWFFTAKKSTSARVADAEAKRKAEEERIRGEIKQSSDDELAKRFNRLAKGEEEKDI